jgi:hypothetical protein
LLPSSELLDFRAYALALLVEPRRGAVEREDGLDYGVDASMPALNALMMVETNSHIFSLSSFLYFSICS